MISESETSDISCSSSSSSQEFQLLLLSVPRAAAIVVGRRTDGRTDGQTVGQLEFEKQTFSAQ